MTPLLLFFIDPVENFQYFKMQRQHDLGLTEELETPGIPDGTVLVIFGASGDLARRKLMPALYHLSREGLLPSHFKIIGLGRRIPEIDEFRLKMKHRVIQYCSHKMEDRFWRPIEQSLFSMKADYYEDVTFERLKEMIKETETEWGKTANKLFYFSTSPSHFELLGEKIAQFGLNTEEDGKWSRIVVEKPFGLDLKSADRLNLLLNKFYDENQIFRIDHFLGKEAVQNILIFRMSNILFQPLWNREYIDHVQITIAETIGVEGRVEFFEQTGAIRDMIQSHALQILAFLTMEHPSSLDPEEIRDEKVRLFRSIRRVRPEDVTEMTVRGQYSEGVVNFELVPGYLEEPGVPENSKVETYVAMKLYIDNFRWRGVPFYIRTGKRMASRKTEIFIQLKQVADEVMPMVLQKQKPIPNTIRMEIQPRAGVEIQMGWKPPGLLTEVEPTSLTIGGKAMLKEPKAYERLLLDAMRGDSTLFIRYDEIREMWKIVDPIIRGWQEENKKLETKGEKLPQYPAGTQGPKIAKEFIKKDGREWTIIEN
ncbi:MAG: glucose-6-phosphate dehydrogenase [Methanobacteriota archaeon]|nr:MAG: glucose-6-phosphate dehydrogenase [Euryarchaeota archaeon]